MTATEMATPPPAADDRAAEPASVRLGIEGMHCASCVTRVERELARTPGVVNALVNLTTDEATVSYLPQSTGLAEVEEAVRRAGYEPRPAPAVGADVIERQEHDREREYRTLMRKFWFAAAI